MLQEQILNELNSINNPFFEFKLSPPTQFSVKGITTYDAVMKKNLYVDSGVLNFSDSYFSHVTNVFSKHKLNVRFNNTGGCFWASF